MANISASMEMRVLPEPITAFRNTTAIDIIKIAADITRTTGMAWATNSPDCPYTENNKPGNKLRKMNMIIAEPRLSRIIFLIKGHTSSCLPWPMMLPTMALVVEPNAQITIPARPRMFRMVLETARAISPCASISRKKYSQLSKLMPC